MRRLTPLITAFFLSGSAWGQDLVLRNATLIDGTGAPPRAGMEVVVRGGRIASIGAPQAPLSGIRAIDLRGRFLLPGLIDAHAHILDPASALRALQSGVTTARVLGDEYFQAMGTRDLIRTGHIDGPELLCSGGHVRPVLGTPFLVTFPQFGRYIREKLEGPENVSAVVRALLDRGVDVIKVGASERAGLAATDPRRQELKEEEIQAAVREALRDGKFVAAHAHDEAGAEGAVRGGVRSVEHGTYLNDRTLALMKEKGTFLVPTLAIMSPMADPQSDSAEDISLRIRTWHMQPALRKVVKKALALGIPLAAATDGSYGDGEDTARVRVQHDIEQMVEVGMTPLQAIHAATASGARVLGIEGRTGTLAVEREADFIVIDRDPLEDIRAIHEPLLVITNGKVVVDRLYPDPYDAR
jgi:imidazolonepropionase-like amidohydrolase